jgi:DNA-binding transcriptional LysR family regulator
MVASARWLQRKFRVRGVREGESFPTFSTGLRVVASLPLKRSTLHPIPGIPFLGDVLVNVHHLELFFYVARHNGISAAVRHIPYGVQQPAISGQMRQLEDDVGEKLFERSPFRLTDAGIKLYKYIGPFFEGMGTLAKELEVSRDPIIRVGAAELVLRDHISVIMQTVEAAHPKLRMTLHAGDQSQVEDWLHKDIIDLAITSVGMKAPPKLRQWKFATIPLVLLVRRGSPLKRIEDLWAQKKITAPLISQSPKSTFMRDFQRELKRRHISWTQTVEVTSSELVMRYVASGAGYGIGNMAIPSIARHRTVRVLPLEGFSPLVMGALWKGELKPLMRAVLVETSRYTKKTFPPWTMPDPLP